MCIHLQVNKTFKLEFFLQHTVSYLCHYSMPFHVNEEPVKSIDTHTHTYQLLKQ